MRDHAPERHRPDGAPFEEPGVRFARLEEHLAAVRGLWDPERQPCDQRGDHARLHDAVFQLDELDVIGLAGRDVAPRS